MKPDERYADGVQLTTGEAATPEPHEELHLRVITLEVHANNQQRQIEAIDNAIASLRDQMDKVFTELGLA